MQSFHEGDSGDLGGILCHGGEERESLPLSLHFKKGGGLVLLPQFLWTSLCEILHSSLITNVKENCVEYNDGEDDADDNYIKTMMVMAITILTD